jgi:hypothetical protein
LERLFALPDVGTKGGRKEEREHEKVTLIRVDDKVLREAQEGCCARQ